MIIPTKQPTASERPARSAILFGPPGTAKTTIARSLARELGGWPLIELSPGDFCTKGIDGIFARLKEVFEHLFLLENVVVLFDEIDELVMAREVEKEKFGRFITTSMLPWFQQLRDQDNLIFLVNTNHVERYDSAIRRPGRFDLVLPVGAPTKEQMRSLLTKCLGISDGLGEVERVTEVLEGVRTIGEILDVARVLKAERRDEWVNAAVLWDREHRAVTTSEAYEDFESHIREFARR